MAEERTEIASIGEFALIDRIRLLTDLPADDAPVREHLLKGIGDDAAVYRPPAGAVELITTDALLEGVHFDLTYTSFRHLGWKAVAASLSDIAAMGGVPRYVLMTLSIPAKISVEMVEEFYSGAAFACKKYSCVIVGGDTATSPANLMVSSTVIGEASVEKHLMPKPRLDMSGILAGPVTVHSMIDISDGLASEVHHLCAHGEVGASIHEHNLPIDPLTQRIADEFSDSATDYALYGGEEYELLFTISEEEYQKLEKLTNDVSIIGRITKPREAIELVREQGEHEALSAGGWNHFLR